VYSYDGKRTISLPHNWILEGMVILMDQVLCNYFVGESLLLPGFNIGFEKHKAS